MLGPAPAPPSCPPPVGADPPHAAIEIMTSVHMPFWNRRMIILLRLSGYEGIDDGEAVDASRVNEINENVRVQEVGSSPLIHLIAAKLVPSARCILGNPIDDCHGPFDPLLSLRVLHEPTAKQVVQRRLLSAGLL